MTVVVLGLDALDPDLTDEEEHPHLTLATHRPIETISSSKGEPSTHELWPTIFTGLKPEDHGLVLEKDGVAWENPFLRIGSTMSDYVLPDLIQRKVGEWILTNTGEDAFRTPATYFEKQAISTIFDDFESKPIGIPNYVVNTDNEDREHTLRQNLGPLFERDATATGGHVTSDPSEFYERCLEMAMVRIARIRRSLRSNRYELVFGYTSALDLIGHVAHDKPSMQKECMREINQFVGELKDDLGEKDELLIVSDHGLKNGVHTAPAMVAGTSSEMVASISSVLDVRSAIEEELRENDHQPSPRTFEQSENSNVEHVQNQLEDLGYM